MIFYAVSLFCLGLLSGIVYLPVPPRVKFQAHSRYIHIRETLVTYSGHIQDTFVRPSGNIWDTFRRYSEDIWKTFDFTIALLNMNF